MVFQNGKTISAHVIMHCTGYKYHFPFLETNGIISVDDNRVGPLYKHIFLHHLYQRSLHRYNMEGTKLISPFFLNLFVTFNIITDWIISGVTVPFV